MDKEFVNISSNRFAYLFFKRILDIIGGIVGCLITLVLAVVIKMANIMDKDYDSVFYKQVRKSFI